MFVLIVVILQLFNCFGIEFYTAIHALFELFEVTRHLGFEHFLHDIEVGSVGNVTDSCHNLKLCSTFIDGENAGIAHQSLCLVLHNKARTTVNADAIVGILVRKL